MHSYSVYQTAVSKSLMPGHLNFDSDEARNSNVPVVYCTQAIHYKARSELVAICLPTTTRLPVINPAQANYLRG